MQNIGLSVPYAQADGAVREHVRSVAALAHLPPADILEGWLALMGECPITYIRSWRISMTTLLKRGLQTMRRSQWAFGTSMGTNNNVEIWNLKFSKLVRKLHHNILEFVDAIRKEQAATELKTAQHHAAVQPARKKKKYIVVNQRLAQFKQEYVNGERSLLRFLHAAGHLLKLE